MLLVAQFVYWQLHAAIGAQSLSEAWQRRFWKQGLVSRWPLSERKQQGEDETRLCCIT